jgi:hypothetical protein
MARLSTETGYDAVVLEKWYVMFKKAMSESDLNKSTQNRRLWGQNLRLLLRHRWQHPI